MIPYADLNPEKIQVEEVASHKKGGKSKKYCTSVLTFDIEVSSAWITATGDVIGYEKGKGAEYWNELEPLALPYIWQFSIDDTVYFGRELRDFEKVLQLIPSDLNCIIWVHNLSYEFQHLLSFLTFSDVFARSPHKPMKAVPENYPNIEFRCSYMLTRLSLDAWGKELGFEKATGDLDYEVLRTPLTELTDAELNYCERDCLVVYRGILKYMEKYGRQQDIPLTQTGTVRRVVKGLLMNDDEYCKWIKRLVPRNAAQYKNLQRVFAGGYTHANRFYAGHVVTGLIEHYDFASSYPTVMVAEKYPSTPWVYRGHTMPDESRFDSYAYMLHLRFYDLECTTFNTYIQYSKTISTKGATLDNGRVMSADELEIYITEQDYLTIKESYDFEVECLHVWSSYKQYLPTPFVEYILQLYMQKTSYKGVEGMEDIYGQSKQYINSLFGMSVTNIVQSDVRLDGDVWYVDALTPEMVDEKLQKLSKGWKGDKRYFLSYSWGCWVCAYGRRNLWRCILAGNNDHDVLYCDTDSIFIKGSHDFTWYNEQITEKLRIACEHHGIDFSMTRPKTPKGVEKPLGVFDQEESCTEFITLGAKRYCERRSDGLHLTISGINKGAVELLNDDISNFRDGFDFNMDADCVTKKLSTYLCEMPEVVWPDGYVSTYTHGINLRRTGYLLSVTDEYKDLIKYYDYDIMNLPEQALVRMRGVF